jgi:hypothetical protein
MDKIKEQFNKTLEKINAINKPVSLIENGVFKKEFTANGTKYVILPADEVFNINRQVAYHNIETAFALNQTPTDIKLRFNETWQTIIKLMSAKGDEKDKLMNKFLRDALNNLDSFKGELTSRYPAAYYICSLFIIKEGEDLGKWNFESADEKINDWTEANIKAVDFLGLALATSKESQAIIKNILADS